MEIYQGVLLGILQGLTEFLPVSSSGHLVLGQMFFGLKESLLSFDISVHMGTLAAVLVVYLADIRRMGDALGRFAFGSGEKSWRHFMDDGERRFILFILLGSVPTALIGLGLKKMEHILFSSGVLVGSMLILTGCILWVSRKFYGDESQGERVNGIRAIWIGVVQGLAVIPGISRSGSTICAGMAAGLNRHEAARFSFLLSIPAILGAQVLSLKDMIQVGGGVDGATLWGTLASFLTGLLALKLLLKLVDSGKFHFFAPYCWGLGILVLLSKFV